MLVSVVLVVVGAVLAVVLGRGGDRRRKCGDLGLGDGGQAGGVGGSAGGDLGGDRRLVPGDCGDERLVLLPGQAEGLEDRGGVGHAVAVVAHGRVVGVVAL